MQCLKCNSELIYIEPQQIYICPKCGTKYEQAPSEENETTNNIDDDIENSLVEQDCQNKTSVENVSSANKKFHFKPVWISYIISIVLMITLITLFSEPIVYGAEYEYHNKYYTNSIVFQRNNTCLVKSSNDVSIRLYFIEGDTIKLDNTTYIKIKDRFTLEEFSSVYRCQSIGHIFLIILTILSWLLSIAFTIYKHSKKPKNNRQRN